MARAAWQSMEIFNPSIDDKAYISSGRWSSQGHLGKTLKEGKGIEEKMLCS
jgi:hypothetical protein